MCTFLELNAVNYILLEGICVSKITTYRSDRILSGTWRPKYKSTMEIISQRLCIIHVTRSRDEFLNIYHRRSSPGKFPKTELQLFVHSRSTINLIEIFGNFCHLFRVLRGVCIYRPRYCRLISQFWWQNTSKSVPSISFRTFAGSLRDFPTNRFMVNFLGLKLFTVVLPYERIFYYKIFLWWHFLRWNTFPKQF